MSKVLVVVQARMASSRLPGKVLADICGRPALDHLLDRALLPGFPVLVATTEAKEDAEIIKLAASRNVAYFAGLESITKRYVRILELYKPDVVVRITGDDILVEPDYIHRIVQYHSAHGADFTQMPDLPKGFDCEAISPRALRVVAHYEPDNEYIGVPLANNQIFNVHYMAVRPEHRRTQIVNLLKPEFIDTELRRTRSYELHTPEDLELLRGVFRALYRKGEKPFGIDDVLALEGRHG